MRPAVRKPCQLLASILLLQLVAACGGSDAPQLGAAASPSSPPSPGTSVASSTPPWSEGPHGHFRGTAAIAEPESSHYVEGLVTADGAVRLHMGGPGLAGGVLSGAGIPLTAFGPEAMQFVGRVSWSGNSGTGSGLVIGESCAQPAGGRWCGIAVPAEITVSGTSRHLVGAIRVDTAQGEESWPIDLAAWSGYYESGAALQRLRGIHSERFAPFARDEPVVIDVDGGRLFFQSPFSGCTGNADVTPHGDGRFFVFDVALTIENCSVTYAAFNGRFGGLATVTQGGYWDYDSWLVMLVSTPAGASPAALLMTATRL